MLDTDSTATYKLQFRAWPTCSQSMDLENIRPKIKNVNLTQENGKGTYHSLEQKVLNVLSNSEEGCQFLSFW